MGYRIFSYKRRLYRILVNEITNGFTHISIERVDTKPIMATWDVMQAIKNDVVGEDRYAVEVFPDMDSLVYSANMRHLFVFPEGERLPIGLPLWDGTDVRDGTYWRKRSNE